MEKFGRYTLKASLALADGTLYHQNITFAKLPPFRELTEEQKMASPYGLNVHSGDKIVIDPFKKAGIVWFREYAFQWDWVLRAKGADRRYAGWPYYNKMVQAYTDEGVKILPVTQQSLKAPEVKNGKVSQIGPDEDWTREMASLVLAFPQVTHWELSNEYDLLGANQKAEELCDGPITGPTTGSSPTSCQLLEGQQDRSGKWPGGDLAQAGKRLRCQRRLCQNRSRQFALLLREPKRRN